MVADQNTKDMSRIGELKRMAVCGEPLYYSLSFDIGRYDGGAFWLQIYDEDKRMVSDEPFVASWGDVSPKGILKRIREQLPLIKWPL